MSETAPHAPASDPFSATQQRAEANARLVVRGIGLNAVLAVVKIAGGIFGHTYALIADGAESTLDVLSSSLVWAGVRVAGRPPDANHPYGHGKAEPLTALAVAVFVFAMAAWVAIQSIHEIITPHGAPRWWTLPLLAVIVAAKYAMSRRIGARGRAESSTGLGVEAQHHWSDAITSFAAFVGIAIALLGGGGWENADDWAALAACGVIAFNGASMMSKALHEVMDTAVPERFEAEIRGLALSVPGVCGLHKVRVRKSGLSYLVDLQIRVDGNLTVRAGHDIAHAVKNTLIGSARHRVTDVTIHVEPAT